MLAIVSAPLPTLVNVLSSCVFLTYLLLTNCSAYGTSFTVPLEVVMVAVADFVGSVTDAAVSATATVTALIVIGAEVELSESATEVAVMVTARSPGGGLAGA